MNFPRSIASSAFAAALLFPVGAFAQETAALQAPAQAPATEVTAPMPDAAAPATPDQGMAPAVPSAQPTEMPAQPPEPTAPAAPESPPSTSSGPSASEPSIAPIASEPTPEAPSLDVESLRSLIMSAITTYLEKAVVSLTFTDGKTFGSLTIVKLQQ
ncbi:hypothetical protein HY627_01790 [Candidatus Uhrbacteria bacterium]|nr:hypothetical protein [Candidatus Uhrbacteria bacterium]